MCEENLAAVVGAFYSAHRQELFTYALSITRAADVAEDAVHEAIRRLLSNKHAPREIRPYAFRCVRNAALDLLRQAQRDARKLEDYRLLFDDAHHEPLRESVAELLAELTEQEREIVVLKIFSGLTFREIADVCGARQGTVASSYWRCLNRLRANFAPSDNPNFQTGEQQA
jgi:RNA polymerase sigma-70 factor (ECF subfamily)